MPILYKCKCMYCGNRKNSLDLHVCSFNYRVGFYNEQFLFPFPYSDQVYNETIRDLLLPSEPLKMRDDRGTLLGNPTLQVETTYMYYANFL